MHQLSSVDSTFYILKSMMKPLFFIAIVYVLILLSNLIVKHTEFKMIELWEWQQGVLVLCALALIIAYWIMYLYFLLGF